MKKTLYFLLLISLFSSLKAQKYQPIDSTIIWNTEEVGKNWSCYVKAECKYYLKGYELNNSRSWNKIYKSFFTYGISFANCTTYVPGPPTYNSFFGYVWEDTLNKKVYFKYNLPVNYTPVTNDLIYDFKNKNVGDTMYFQIPSQAYMYRFGINAIDSVLFSGKYHKRYLTTCAPSQMYLNGKNVTFTEGVGSSIGVFTHTVNGLGEAWSYLNCFATPTQTMSITNHSVYTNGGSCTNIALGISEKDPITRGIFPNPTSNYFIIQSTDSPEEITYQVYNSLGQIQLSGTTKDQEQINTETLNKGVYFVKLSGRSQSEARKLVIQKE